MARNPGDGLSAWQAACQRALAYMRSPDGVAEGLRAVTFAELQSADFLVAAMDEARHAGGGNACPRASASIWSKHLVAALLPAPTLHALAGVAFPLPPVLLFDGPRAVALMAEPPAEPEAWVEPALLADFLRGILEPVLLAVARHAGLAPRVLWSNTATMLAWLTEQWRRQPTVASRSEAIAAAVLQARGWPDGTGNPLHRQIDYVPTDIFEYPLTRRRRLCCLRDRLGHPLCASCPKITPEARDALIRASL